MRRFTLVMIAALALAACGKKDDAKKKPVAAQVDPGAGQGTATGSATAGSATAGSATGSAAVAPAGDPGGAAAANANLANKAGNCPSAVLGATTTIVDDPAATGKLVLTITANNDSAVATIRKRVAHLVEVQAAADSEIKHTGDGTGGGGGMCPVITTKDTKIAGADVDGGSKVTIEPQNGTSVEALRKEVEARITKTSDWTQANISGTSSSGGGGGTGGGKGDHGGNHSGKGNGEGKKDPPPPPTSM